MFKYITRFHEKEVVWRYMQGFPILINGTPAGENEIKSLVVLSVKIAHLPRDIAHPNAIQETQDGTVELSEEAGNLPRARLAGVFS